jgi:hypothetical protein
MKQTAIQQAIAMVRSRIESIDETLMGKHTIHHLQQIERGLYQLLETEPKEPKEQTKDAAKSCNYIGGATNIEAEQYYNETYGHE